MKVDRRNLQIKLVRGRTQRMFTRLGQWTAGTPDPTGYVSYSFTTIDITGWVFAFTMSSNFATQQPTIAVTYNPIVNLADPTQGQLMWDILASDTKSLAVGNYVFDMSVTGSDNQPRFFCSGTVPLYDFVTNIPTVMPARVSIGTGTSTRATPH